MHRNNNSKLKNATTKIRRTTYGLPADLHKEVRVRAAAQEQTPSELVVEALRAYFAKEAA